MSESIRREEAPLEAALRAVVQSGKRSMLQLAAALEEDGFEHSLAHLVAAAAQLRYDPAPLDTLLEREQLEAALRLLREHAARARRNLHPDAALLYGRDHGNELRVEERQVKLLLSCEPLELRLYSQLLDPAECEAIIALARGHLRASETVSFDTGVSGVESARRSSSTAFVDHDQSAHTQRITRRVSALLGCEVSQCEPIAVTFYPVGAEFLPHVDYLEDRALVHLGSRGQRIATVIVYLSDVEEGGTTCFPVLGLEIRPQRGNALCFGYRRGDGTPDPDSLHASRPVLRGEKWIATFWFHAP